MRLEHCIRWVNDEGAVYWTSVLGNAGWRMQACVQRDGLLGLFCERPAGTLQRRLEEELTFARDLSELGDGVRGLLGDAPRPTMPAAGTQHVEEGEESKLRVGLWAGGQLFDEVVFAGGRGDWRADELLRVLSCADNLLPVFKLTLGSLRELLRSGNAGLERLQTLLGARAVLTASASGNTVQVCRGDEHRFHLPWGGKAPTRLVLQATSGGELAWQVHGQAEKDPAVALVRALPGCVE